MNIKTSKVYNQWIAYDDDTYDGAEDGSNELGTGKTEQEAIDELMEIINDGY